MREDVEAKDSLCGVISEEVGEETDSAGEENGGLKGREALFRVLAAASLPKVG